MMNTDRIPQYLRPIGLIAILGFGLATQASAAIMLFEENFNDGDLSTPGPAWGGVAYNNNTNTNPSTQTVTSEVISGGNSAIQLRANFPGPPTGSGAYSGTQISKSLTSTIFNGYASSDIFVTFDLAVTSDKVFAGTLGSIVVEIREAGRAGGSSGATHRFKATPVDLTGTFGSYSFTLDTNTIGTFPATPFGAGDKQLYFQVQSNYTDSGMATQTDLRVDNIIISAVPEPSSAVLCAGTLGLLMARRRR